MSKNTSRTFLLTILMLWGRSALAQVNKVSDELSEDQRIYGLSKIWNEAKTNFVYFDRLKVDWDSLYQATLPKVRAASNITSYYDELKRFAANLHDGHTGVWYPMSFYSSVAAYAPLKTSLVDNKVYITAVLNDTLRQQGISEGMEIVKINGLETKQYAELKVAPFEGASTPQGHDMMVYSTYLLNGPAWEPLKLTLCDKNGKIIDHTISRKLTIRKLPAFRFEVRTGNVGLLTINSFDAKDFKVVFDSLYVQILKTKALIIDLRTNGGGDGSQGIYILKHLTSEPFSGPLSSYRQDNAALRSWGLKTQTFFQPLPTMYTPFKDRAIYNKPVAVLIGKQTYSAAEDFTVLFDAARRGIVAGEPSGGSTGQPAFFDLPGGGTFRVCIKKDAYPDGKPFVGIGVQPALLIRQTGHDLKMGKDPVMKKILAILNKN